MMKGLDEYLTQTPEEYKHRYHKKFTDCDNCSETIYEGQKYYDFDGYRVCEDCVDDYIREHRRTAGE